MTIAKSASLLDGASFVRAGNEGHGIVTIKWGAPFVEGKKGRVVRLSTRSYRAPLDSSGQRSVAR